MNVGALLKGGASASDGATLLDDGTVDRNKDPLWIATSFGHCEVGAVLISKHISNPITM